MRERLYGPPAKHDEMANRRAAELSRNMRATDADLKRADLSQIETDQVRCNGSRCGLRVGAIVRTPMGSILIDLPVRGTPYLLGWEHRVSPELDAMWDDYQPLCSFHCIRHGSLRIGWDCEGRTWIPREWNRQKWTILAQPNRD